VERVALAVMQEKRPTELAQECLAVLQSIASSDEQSQPLVRLCAFRVIRSR
jgi:hypothetical protein